MKTTKNAYLAKLTEQIQMKSVNVGKNLEVNCPGIGGGTGDDQLGIALLGHIPDLIIVDEASLGIHIIGNHIVVLTGDVGRAAVGQMTAVGKAHAHHGIAGLQQS